jgi:hypothetical protein
MARSGAQQFADDKQLQEVIIQGDKHKRKVLSQPILINIPEGRKQTIDAFEKCTASIGLKVKGVFIVSI